jgi:hypothetical protein
MNGLFKSYLAIALGVAGGSAICIGFQKHLNAEVTKHCNTSIYSIAYSKSSVGDVAHCVSRAPFYGPGTPLKD